MTISERRRALRALIDGERALSVPGAYDCVSAGLIEEAGFPTVYIGSYAISASAFGLPDVGLLGMSEMVDRVKNVVDAVSVPVIADAENGFNDAANIWRTVRAFERAGAAAIHIEDHEFGKHADVPQVILPLEDMLGRVRAALDAREDSDFLIAARTDVAWATGDVEEAIRRANEFYRAGADMVFLTGIAPPVLGGIRSRIEGKVMVVDTPGCSVADEERAGADVVLYYGLALYAAHAGVRHALASFEEEKDAHRLSGILTDAGEFERFFGYEDFAARTAKYAPGRPDAPSGR
jgi:2-methylisocitrate lyase-like PEP mutase family enzyme